MMGENQESTLTENSRSVKEGAERRGGARASGEDREEVELLKLAEVIEPPYRRSLLPDRR
jgi:hypothetical protein